MFYKTPERRKIILPFSDPFQPLSGPREATWQKEKKKKKTAMKYLQKAIICLYPWHE